MLDNEVEEEAGPTAEERFSKACMTQYSITRTQFNVGYLEQDDTADEAAGEAADGAGSEQDVPVEPDTGSEETT